MIDPPLSSAGGTAPEHDQALTAVDEFSALARERMPAWLVPADNALKRQVIESLIHHHRDETAFAARLAAVQSPVVFARPLLINALKTLTDTPFDVDHNVLVLIKRFPLNPLGDAIKDPVQFVLPTALIPVVNMTHLSLLEAALQNFSSQEVRDELGGEAFILERHANPKRSGLNPLDFARMCRTLNVGQQYQRYLHTVFPAVEATQESALATSLQPQFLAHERSRLAWLSHKAYLTREITHAGYTLLLQWLQGEPNLRWGSREVRVCSLSLLSIKLESGTYGQCPLYGALVFIGKPTAGETQLPCMVYMPHDKERPLYEYPSLQHFNDAFALRLRETAPRAALKKTVELRYQAALMKQLQRALRFKGLTTSGVPVIEWRTEAQLDITLHDTGEPPWFALYRQYSTLSLSNARTLAVPTDHESDESLLQRLVALFEAGQPLFNLAAFFVPGLGEVVLLAAAVQLLSELYTGVEDWSHGEVTQALEHFGSVAQNLLVMGVGARASSAWASIKPPLHTPALLGRVEPVSEANGQKKLFKVDLAPYRSPVVLEPALQPDAHGVYHVEGHQYVHIQGRPYEVVHTAQTQQWRLRHPVRPGAYAPLIESDNHGVWHLALERPVEWSKSHALHRASPHRFAFSEAKIEQMGHIVGTYEAALRWSHVQRERPPALVLDTLKRFNLAEEVERQIAREQAATGPSGSVTALTPAQKKARFDQRYASSERFSEGLMTTIHQQYPSLPASVVSEVAERARVSEMKGFDHHGKVPLRLAEELRLYSHELKTVRALEGCFLDVADPTLTLKLVTAFFSQTSRGRHYVDKDPVLYRRPDNPGMTPLQALHALGLIKTDPGLRNEFARHVHNHPEQTRTALGLQPIKPWFRSPLRLANGRVGYPLGGERGEERTGLLVRRVQSIYPACTREQSLELISALESRRVWPESELVRLQLEHESLEDVLRTWCSVPLPEHSSAARRDVSPATIKRAVSSAIRRAWRRESRVLQDASAPSAYLESGRLSPADLPDLRGYLLDLTGMPAGDLPKLAGDFSHVSVLVMDDMALDSVPEQFLQSFTRVRWLSMQNNRLTRLPLALANMKSLQKLDLSGNAIELTAEGAAHLSELGNLKELNLLGNPLGLPVDVSDMSRLQYLNLRHTQATTWPIGVHALNTLKSLDLRDNLIREIPDAAFSAPQDLNAVTYLHDNPLTPAAEERLDSYARRTGINMGFVSERVHDRLSDLQRHAWLLSGDDATTTRLMAIWNNLEHDLAADDLRRFLGELRSTPAYVNESTRAAFIERVGSVLQALGENNELRESLIARIHQGSTCAEPAALTFSDFELLAAVAKVKLEASQPGHERKLLQLARHLFRLNQVEGWAQYLRDERLAYRFLDGVGAQDEVSLQDLRLVMRMALAQPLALPWQPQADGYPHLPSMPAMGVNSIRRQVLLEEASGDQFLDFIGSRDFWVAFLKNKYSDRFARLHDTYMRQSNRVEFGPRAISDQVYQSSLEVIKAAYNAAEKDLITQLTRQEMTDHPL